MFSKMIFQPAVPAVGNQRMPLCLSVLLLASSSGCGSGDGADNTQAVAPPPPVVNAPPPPLPDAFAALAAQQNLEAQASAPPAQPTYSEDGNAAGMSLDGMSNLNQSSGFFDQGLGTGTVQQSGLPSGFSGGLSLDGTPFGVGSVAASGDLSSAVSFVQQNCVSCHGSAQAKGELRLDGITADMQLSAPLWKMVVSALEDGSMPPPSSIQPDANLKAQVIDLVRGSLGSEPQDSYLARAVAAYKEADRQQADRFYFAHVLTTDDAEANEHLKHIRLYRPHTSKPEDLVAANAFAVNVKPRLTTELRLAVGVVLAADDQVTDVRPIGINQFTGAGLASDSGFGQGGPTSKLETFEDLTGDFGKALLAAFSKRRSAGNFGTLFCEVQLKRQSINPPGGEIPGGLGMGFGQAQPAGMAFGANTGQFGGMEVPKTKAGQTLVAGLVYLGTGKANELLSRAVQAQVDGLFLFDVSASRNNRTGLVTNETKLRFMLPSGKVVAASSRALKNTDVERAIQLKKENEMESVKASVEPIFARLDQILVLEDLPKMTDKAALKQIHTQIHSDVDRLQIMAHAKLFASKGILTAEQLATIYQIILQGNEGITLASGTTADRAMVIGQVWESL
ncbi:MAG: hypothetical protein KF752_04455 [Pirellulaceae bacterium]|nr:hypothetical protein [Pirellulaceae bacterium]